MEIILASNNKHKIEELKQILGTEYTLKSLAEIGCYEEIEEYGTTFHQNSEIKAKYVFDKFGLNVIADDSGLEIEALGGKPGVYSARYAGEPTNHSANIQKVLSELENSTNRSARFVTIITLFLDGQKYFFEGEIKGTITKNLKGSSGFGYDPVFIPDGYTLTFAEMSAELKNSISHRKNALLKMINFLKKNSK
jgi:XTP/dITP diphosphohydrolase